MKSPKAAVPKPCCSLAITGQEQERLIAMFRALGNPLRFSILKFLLTHSGCITNDIVKFLPIAQATTSQHLKVLLQAGWIRCETEGRASCYRLDEARIAWFKKKVDDIF